MPLNTIDIARMSQIEGISHIGIQELCFRTLMTQDTRRDLADLILKNEESLGLHDITRNKIYQAFNRADDIMDKSIRMGIKTYSKLDYEYPHLLRYFPDAPLLLHAKGNIEHLNNRVSLGVIGSSRPSDLGKEISGQIGKELGGYGFNVVGRLTPGIDAAAMEGALKAGGIATAILATGLDAGHTKETRDLLERILQNDGLLISDRWAGTKPTAYTYASRNSVLAGSTNGLALVESGLKEGSMLAVNQALEFGKRVAVYKHDSPDMTEKFEGNKHLLKSGQVSSVNDAKEVHSFAQKTVVENALGKKITM